MQSIADFAADGGLVMGICNGFQILIEAGLLPGALLRNTGLKFVCRYVNLLVEADDTPFTSTCAQGDLLRIVVKHNEGNYTVDAATLATMKANRQIVLRYAAAAGAVTASANPNGSLQNIAGVCNATRNVFGMMPRRARRRQPERRRRAPESTPPACTTSRSTACRPAPACPRTSSAAPASTATTPSPCRRSTRCARCASRRTRRL